MYGPPPSGVPAPPRPLGPPGGAPPFGAPPAGVPGQAPPTAAFQQMNLGPPGQAPGGPPPAPGGPPPGAFGQPPPFARNPPAGPFTGPPGPATSPPGSAPNSAPGPFARSAPPPFAAAGPQSAGAPGGSKPGPPSGLFGGPRPGMPSPLANGPPAPGALPPPPPGLATPPPPGGFAPPPTGAPPPPGPGGLSPPFAPQPGAPAGPPGPGFPPPPPFGAAPGMPPPPVANGGPPPGPPGLPGPPPAFPPPPAAFPRPGAPAQSGYFPPPGAGATRPVPPSFGAPPPPPGARGSTPPAPAAPPSRANQSRIDPSQIPRPTARPTEVTVFETRVNGAHNFPLPPSTSQFVVKDMGNASPRLIRSTLNSVPHTRDLCNSSAMPFVVVLSPMALPDPADDPIQIVDNGEYGPVRCSRCKAYMNPFMKWVSGARSFVCNMCGHTNPCPDFFFCHASGDGRRRDADERPELCKGTVEYVATGDYYLRPPMPPVHFFLVDVSQTAISSGATAACCAAIEQVLDAIQGQDRAQVGLATFDSAIHFYSLRSASEQAQMLVVTDIEDAFAPASFPLTAPLAECRSSLESLLNSIPQWFSSNLASDTATLSAITAAVDAIGSTGGKLHVFASMLARIGAHKLTLREQNLMGDKADKEKLGSLLTQDNTLKQLAVAAAERQVCIDLFFLNQHYVDIASMSDLVTVTGGSLYNYQPWNPLLDTDQLLNDLRWNIARPQALEAVMRVRSSAGLDVETYSGSFYKPTTADLIFPALDSDKAVVCKLSHQERLALGECYIQSALLYTSTQGERRIRVSTIALPVTDNISTVFKGADLDAQVTYLTRRICGQLPGNSLNSCQEMINNYAVNVLHAYRKYCATSSSAVQLILPEALKLLPLYTLSLLKSVGMQRESKPDGRSTWITKMQSSACKEVLPRLHPRLIALHTLVEPPPDGQQQITIPLALPLSAEHLKTGGVYLLEDGDSFLVLVDKATSPQLAQELLGDSLEAIQAGGAPMGLPVLDTPFNRAVQAVISQIRLQRCSYMRLRVVKRNDPLEVLFYNRLLEDKTSSGMSYVDSLCHVHRLIQNKMS